MAKRGRPVSDDPKRNRVITRLTDSEYDQLVSTAKHVGLSVADFIRESVRAFDLGTEQLKERK